MTTSARPAKLINAATHEALRQIKATSVMLVHTQFTRSDPYSQERCSQLLQDVLEEPHDLLGQRDLALLNLLCAPALAGSEELNIAKCLTRVDELTAIGKSAVKRSLARFRNFPPHPDFGRCEPMWLMGLLITIVKRDFGASYRPSLRDDLANRASVLYRDSKDTFIHGLLVDDRNKRWGTCASLPVLVTTVARRLGFPVRLAVAGWHVYCRWDTGKPGGISLNIEASGPTGMTIHPDEYYRQKINPQLPAEESNSYYLRSLTPAEEFGLFMRMRVEHLIHEERYADTLLWSARSLQFCPADPLFPHMAYSAMELALRQRHKMRYPERVISNNPKEFRCDVRELLAVEELPLYFTICAHRSEAAGDLEEAAEHYEKAWKHNVHGYNEKRDLQRFLNEQELTKHDRRRTRANNPCDGDKS